MFGRRRDCHVINLMQDVYEQENISMECTLNIWERIIERRLSDAEFGFIPCRGMADGIFAVWQRMEKQGQTGQYNGIYRSRKCVRYRPYVEYIVNKYGGAIERRDCQIIM